MKELNDNGYFVLGVICLAILVLFFIAMRGLFKQFGNLRKEEKLLNDSFGLNEFLKTHETFQLALIEAVHRYYHDNCFTGGENSRFKDDEESRTISALLQTLHCSVPDWRYRLKKKMERYNAWEKTTALDIDSKPKKFFCIDIIASIAKQQPPN